ncbi:MAG: hypothetical protein KAI70_06690, partial [Candidatus Omnitrophica bacterium]|nr:hypothetical protein [Candidatus Omnitrophota bacterium]
MKNRDIYLIFAIIFLIIFAIISLYFIIDLCLITERRTYFELFNKELYKTPILSSEQVKAPKTKKYL